MSFDPSKRRRLILGIGLSVLVVAVTGLNVLVLRENPLAVKLQDFGQWLSGVASALAFIWLIVSYFQQGEELELQRQELAATREQLALQKAEMARLADEAARQAKSVEATEQHARGDTFMRLSELAQAIEATLLRSLDASLFKSKANQEATNSGRDFYLAFANYLTRTLLDRELKHRNVSTKDGQLLIYLWNVVSVAPMNSGWSGPMTCSMSEVELLLWFDEMLAKEAAEADRSGALVKFVEALPSQKAILSLRQLRSQITDTALPDTP